MRSRACKEGAPTLSPLPLLNKTNNKQHNPKNMPELVRDTVAKGAELMVRIQGKADEVEGFGRGVCVGLHATGFFC